MLKKSYPGTGLEVAIIGMSVRMPGADTLVEFWDNLKNGTESITFFSDEQLKQAGVADEMINNPSYVKAKGIIDQSMSFEPELFNFNDREATLMDPQIRIIHECVFQALNDSGHQSEHFEGPIGLYGGSGTNFLWSEQFLSSDDNSPSTGYETISLNAQEYAYTRVAHSLNLSGPALTIQTACSSSLVAVHAACQGLIAGDCDMAIAGGVQMRTDASLNEPDVFGYLHEEGMILSKDGHCRPFDDNASGTSFSDGAGFVVLKRLEDAVADNDHIYAVIKGTAINNDGDSKVGFMAPSAKGQAEVIRTTQIMAETEPETIGYIEAHGTGTALGDPIEVKALSEVFTNHDKHVCHLGSVKSNIGHLGAAAGVAGLIKTVLAIHHGKIPPTVHYNQSNSKIDFMNSPFVVNAELANWPDQQAPFRAGVSSFGIGGTNAHAILEEYVSENSSDHEQTTEDQIIMLSATSKLTLLQHAQQLSKYLSVHPDLNIQDIAHTLDVGRRHLPYRISMLCDTTSSLINQLDQLLQENIHMVAQSPEHIVFMFPGQGSQYYGMFEQFYQTDSTFKKYVNQCLTEHDLPELQSLKNTMWGQSQVPDAINETDTAQLCLFICEYAMANCLIDRGIKPTAMIGHSLGEYVAATISGVFTLSQALQLVKKRGELMATTKNGAMVMVFLSVKEISLHLPDNCSLSIAAINTGTNCVVSGTQQDVVDLIQVLDKKGLNYKSLPVNKAFHSELMEEMLPEFTTFVQSIDSAEPNIPFISNVTGLWYKSTNTTQYWADHLRQAVQFDKGINTLLEHNNVLFIEVGPGKTLSSFVKNNDNFEIDTPIITIGHHKDDTITDTRAFQQALSELYLFGVKADWNQGDQLVNHNKVPLPGMVFNRSVYKPKDVKTRQKPQSNELKSSAGDFFQQIWQMMPNRVSTSAIHHFIENHHHIVLLDESDLSVEIAHQFKDISNGVVINYCDHTNNEALLETIKQQSSQLNGGEHLNVIYMNNHKGSLSNLRAVNE